MSISDCVVTVANLFIAYGIHIWTPHEIRIASRASKTDHSFVIGAIYLEQRRWTYLRSWGAWTVEYLWRTARKLIIF